MREKVKERSWRFLSRSSQGIRRKPGVLGAAKSKGTGSLKGVGAGREQKGMLQSCLCSGYCSRRPQTGQLNQQTFIWSLGGWDQGTSMVRFCRGPLPVDRQLLFLCALTWWRGESSCLFLLIRALIPFMGAPPPWPNCLPKGLPAKNITLGLRISTFTFWGGINIQTITKTNGSLSLWPWQE